MTAWEKIKGATSYILETPYILVKKTYNFWFNKTAYHENNTSTFKGWLRYLQWRNNNDKYESELITITDYTCFVTTACKVAFNAGTHYVLRGDTNALALNEFQLDVQQNLLVDLKNKKDILSSTSLTYFEPQKQELLLQYQQRIDEITRFRIPYLKTNREEILLKNSNNVPVDVEKLRAQHVVQLNKKERKIQKSNEAHYKELKEKIEDYIKIEAELFDKKRELANLGNEVHDMRLTMQRKNDEFITLTQESELLKENLESKTKSLDQLTKDTAHLQSISEHYRELQREHTNLSDTLQKEKQKINTLIRDLHSKEKEVDELVTINKNQQKTMQQTEHTRVSAKNASVAKIDSLKAERDELQLNLQARNEKLKGMEKDTQKLLNLVGALTNDKSKTILEIETRFKLSMTELNKIKEQIRTTAEPLLRDNIEIQQLMAQDLKNKKEQLELNNKITALEKQESDTAAAIVIINRNKGIQDTNNFEVITKLNDDLFEYNTTLDTIRNERNQIRKDINAKDLLEQKLQNTLFTLQTNISSQQKSLLKDWESLERRITNLETHIAEFLAMPQDTTGIGLSLLATLTPPNSPERTKSIKQHILNNDSSERHPTLKETPHKVTPDLTKTVRIIPMLPMIPSNWASKQSPDISAKKSAISLKTNKEDPDII